ncbi:MAG: EF-P lysine aminoacylase GenX [Halioglobus sp.]|nr:EF-P lysine aminoacylase GenX [Halioglobus sp.]
MSDPANWRPGAGLEQLRARARLLRMLRDFFEAREVLEVQTPLLCASGVTDPAIEPLVVACGSSLSAPRYLQSSPEYAMKRLLAAGSGAVYQIVQAFRDGESGSRHNPEFTLLEWYRPGFDHHRLMDEVAELVRHCLGERPRQDCSYREVFLELLGLDPFTAADARVEALARKHVEVGKLAGERDMWLDLLMSHVIEPQLADRGMVFVYDYPASQAALSRIVEVDGAQVGQRFELYVDGVELANGYCELGDAVQQRRRFARDNQRRRAAGQVERPIDEYLLAALAHGLPDCSGVALGVDRLLQLATGCADIRQVLTFDWERA